MPRIAGGENSARDILFVLYGCILGLALLSCLVGLAVLVMSWTSTY